MAIDTRQKRFSMMSMASGCDGAGINMLFEPDGTVDLDDRQHLLDCYSGIAFGTPAAAVGRLLLINPPGLDGGFGGGISL